MKPDSSTESPEISMKKLEMHVYEVQVKIPEPYNNDHIRKRIFNIRRKYQREHPDISITLTRYDKSTGVTSVLIISSEASPALIPLSPAE